ncbi:MAG TPA: hypothetical protein VFH03_23780 [Actinoplanes sp.]|nr:hypothetical protein [Actinoplanes sp.]
MARLSRPPGDELATRCRAHLLVRGGGVEPFGVRPGMPTGVLDRPAPIRRSSRRTGRFSFGQKKAPSGFATARLLAVLHRVDDLAGDAAAVDVTALGSSKGGAGTARPPT